MRSCVVKNRHCAFYLVHGNYDELLQLSNVVAFNHNDDYNKQIAVRESDIVYIPAPVTHAETLVAKTLISKRTFKAT